MNEVWESEASTDELSVRAEKRKALARTLALLILTSVSAFLPVLGLKSGAFGLVCAGLCVFAGLVAFPDLLAGIRGFSAGGSDASLRMTAWGAVLAHSLRTAFVAGAECVTYTWLVFLCYTVTFLIRFLSEREMEKNIRLIRDHPVSVAETAPSDLKRRRVRNLCLTRPVDKKPEIAFASRAGDPAKNRNKGFVPVCIGLSLVAPIGALIFGGAEAFWACLVSSFCLCAGLSSEIGCRLPYLFAQHRLREDGCVLPGWNAVARLYRCDTLVTQDTELFPAGTVSVTDLRFRRSFNGSLSMEYLAALLRAADSPAAHALLRVIAFDPEFLPEVRSFRLVPDGGISGEINGHAVLAGNRNLMRAHGIPPLPQSREALIRSATEALMYFAVDGELAAMVLFQYTGEDALAAWLRSLGTEVSVVVDTADSNLTENTVRKAYRADGLRVLIPDADERKFLRKIRRRLEDRPCRPVLVMRRGSGGLFAGISHAKTVYERTVTAITLRQICTIAGITLTAVASFLVPGALSPWWVFLYHLIWVVPVLTQTVDK